MSSVKIHDGLVIDVETANGDTILDKDELYAFLTAIQKFHNVAPLAKFDFFREQPEEEHLFCYEAELVDGRKFKRMIRFTQGASYYQSTAVLSPDGQSHYFTPEELRLRRGVFEAVIGLKLNLDAIRLKVR